MKFFKTNSVDDFYNKIYEHYLIIDNPNQTSNIRLDNAQCIINLWENELSLPIVQKYINLNWKDFLKNPFNLIPSIYFKHLKNKYIKDVRFIFIELATSMIYPDKKIHLNKIRLEEAIYNMKKFRLEKK